MRRSPIRMCRMEKRTPSLYDGVPVYEWNGSAGLEIAFVLAVPPQTGATGVAVAFHFGRFSLQQLDGIVHLDGVGAQFRFVVQQAARAELRVDDRGGQILLRTEEFGVARAAVIGPRFGREREVGDPFLGDDAFLAGLQ